MEMIERVLDGRQFLLDALKKRIHRKILERFISFKIENETKQNKKCVQRERRFSETERKTE